MEIKGNKGDMGMVISMDIIWMGTYDDEVERLTLFDPFMHRYHQHRPQHLSGNQYMLYITRFPYLARW